VAHLVGVADLWTMSFDRGRAGAPTHLFAAFDPVTTPPQLVATTLGWSPAETLARFVESNERLAAAVSDLDHSAWSLTGESPLGHVALPLAAMHALWDGWVHERDITVSLGLVPVEAPAEVALCLCYAVALRSARSEGWRRRSTGPDRGRPRRGSRTVSAARLR
jgi:hypothetical protein